MMKSIEYAEDEVRFQFDVMRIDRENPILRDLWAAYQAYLGVAFEADSESVWVALHDAAEVGYADNIFTLWRVFTIGAKAGPSRQKLVAVSVHYPRDPDRHHTLGLEPGEAVESFVRRVESDALFSQVLMNGTGRHLTVNAYDQLLSDQPR